MDAGIQILSNPTGKAGLTGLHRVAPASCRLPTIGSPPTLPTENLCHTLDAPGAELEATKKAFGVQRLKDKNVQK